jgi:predicted Zn-ribbon and HTH transcriptional regulator
VSCDARFVLSTSWDGTLRVWDPVTGREMMRLDFPGGLHGAAFHPAKPLASFGDLTGRLHLVELADVATGPTLVTARKLGDSLSVQCRACGQANGLSASDLDRLWTCPSCKAELRLTATPIIAPRSAGSSDSAGAFGLAEDTALMFASKTCTACGMEFELLRYACPRCGGTMASTGSPEAQQFAESHQRAAAIHVNRGALLFRQGRHLEAMEEFGEALKLNPMSAQAHANLGVVLRRNGLLAEALECFDRALELDPWGEGFQELRNRTWRELEQHESTGTKRRSWWRRGKKDGHE